MALLTHWTVADSTKTHSVNSQPENGASSDCCWLKSIPQVCDRVVAILLLWLGMGRGRSTFSDPKVGTKMLLSSREFTSHWCRHLINCVRKQWIMASLQRPITVLQWSELCPYESIVQYTVICSFFGRVTSLWLSWRRAERQCSGHLTDWTTWLMSVPNTESGCM